MKRHWIAILIVVSVFIGCCSSQPSEEDKKTIYDQSAQIVSLQKEVARRDTIIARQDSLLQLQRNKHVFIGR